MVKTVVRRARKEHVCSGCNRRIKVGERYNSGVASPNDREVNSCNPHWWRLKECADCAKRYGRPIEEAV